MEQCLYHHGIRGMKWGIRLFQNEDGSLTPRGQKRYINSDGTRKQKYGVDRQTYDELNRTSKINQRFYYESDKRFNKYDGDQTRALRSYKRQQALISAGRMAANTSLTAIGVVGLAHLTGKATPSLAAAALGTIGNVGIHMISESNSRRMKNVELPNRQEDKMFRDLQARLNKQAELKARHR